MKPWIIHYGWYNSATACIAFHENLDPRTPLQFIVDEATACIAFHENLDPRTPLQFIVNEATAYIAFHENLDPRTPLQFIVDEATAYIAFHENLDPRTPLQFIVDEALSAISACCADPSNSMKMLLGICASPGNLCVWWVLLTQRCISHREVFSWIYH